MKDDKKEEKVEEQTIDNQDDAAEKAADVALNKAVDNIADKIVAAISEATGKKVEAEADTSVVKTKLFSGGSLKEVEYPADVSSLSKEEKIVTFFKSLLYARTDAASAQVLRALVEGTDSEGGYLVPEELRAEVFRVLPDFTVMRKIARVIPMASDTLLLNSLAARPSAYWTAEYASKSTTSSEFSQVTLNANDLVCLLPVSEQLLADANINLVNFIIQLFAEAIGATEDKAFFTGTGTGQPRGINQESITTVDAGLTGDFDDVISLIHSVPQRVRNSKSAAFVGHNNVIRQLRTIKDTTNRYLWEPGNPNTGQPDRLYGYPVYEQNDLNQRELYFGDWSYYIIGDRQSIRVATTTEGGEAWRRNAVEIKAVERVDGRAVLVSPFAKISNF